MRERFQRHKNKYKSVKEQSSRTGFGVTEDDRKNGIYTVAGKLESLCTCYQRMDDLYGQKPNINPLAELSLAKTDKSRGFSYEEGLDLDIDALDDTFDGNSNDGDNDGDNDSDNDGDSDNHKERDDNNSNGGLRLRARDLDSVDINNVDDILDGIHESAFTDDADQDHVGEPDIIEVPPTTNPASSQQAARSRSSKRRSSDTESNVSRKSRATDTRKAPPKLDHGPTQTSRNGFANVYMESSVSKLEEERKLEQQKENCTRQIELDQKRVELEGQRIALEREQVESKLRNDEKKLELEEKRLLWEKERQEAETDTKYMMQKAMLVQSALSNGFKLEDIKEIMAMVKER
ncbi:hypothetical protein BG003_000883 [Podila horticola]|nr:hypothetical protein BG003_000883 [Podila horticola]